MSTVKGPLIRLISTVAHIMIRVNSCSKHAIMEQNVRPTRTPTNFLKGPLDQRPLTKPLNTSAVGMSRV